MTELDDLLQQISELIKAFQNKTKSINCNQSTPETSYEKGFNLRENAARDSLEENTVFEASM